MYEPPLNVTRFPGESTRFYVRSQERGKKGTRYVVDLGDADFPLGRCNCDDYEKRIEPKIVRGLEPHNTTCKHIRQVRARIDLCRIICESYGEDESLAPIRIPDVHEYEHRAPAGYCFQAQGLTILAG